MVQRHFSERVVELPGGLINKDGHRLALARMRPLTGAEEDWLAANPDMPSALVVTRILSSCLVQLDNIAVDRDLVRRLLVGDRDFLMLQLRRITLGDQIHAVLSCPVCSARMDIDFGIQDVKVEPRRQTELTYTIEHDNRSLRFRLPVGADQEEVLPMDREAAVNSLLARCVIRDGEGALSSEDRSAVINAMDRLAPQVDLELNLTCPECSHEFLVPFDTTAFFLQEMRQSGRRLLKEAHVLAFYYHWTEPEILSLSRDRRRAYLAMLSDQLRPT